MLKRLLCITPNFSRSGAPIALLGLIRILVRKSQYQINVMAYGKGDLLNSYTEILGDHDNIEILNGLCPSPEFRHKLQNSYDIILLNTAAVYPFSLYFQNTDIPVYWWIHEDPDLIEDSFSGFPNPNLLSPNFKLMSPSTGAAKRFQTHYSYDTFILPVPVFEPSYSSDIPFSLPEDRILFLVPSAYSYIKGQDILLSAINELPHKYRQRSFFIFCGYTIDTQLKYKTALFSSYSNLDNVLMLEDMPQDTVYSLINRCHCVVAPSRIDTIPLTIVEGMMLHKLSLVSDNTGISHYINDCVNGFVFSNQEELVKRLLLIIDDYLQLKHISEKGFNIYHNVFSPSAVSSICDEIGI